MSIPRPILLCLVCLLAACDQIAALDGTKAREADGFAVGSACRQAGRAIEDCFNMNTDSPKASIFAGWKDMNDYMTQNKLDTVAPKVARAEPKPAAKDDAKGEADAGKDGAKDDTKEDTKEEPKDKGQESAKEAFKEPGKPAAAPQPAAGEPAPTQGATLVMPGTSSAPAPALTTGPIVAPGLPTVVKPIPPNH